MSIEALSLPEGYPEFIRSLKDRIRTAQIRAALAVNRELVLLYWGIGRDIAQRQRGGTWGDKIIDRLAGDLRAAFPEMKGLSARNLKYMKALAQAWQDESIVQEVVAQLPWGHNCSLLDKLKAHDERLWYARQTIQNGWSRNVLVHQIESKLFARQGRALTNFERTLPSPQGELAQQILKDPYNFDFLALGPQMLERDLERGLIEHLRDLILELGKGFAFVGSQYHLEIGGQDYYVDLLFYHLRLRCFVVIDLKIEDFKPEFAGKMNFYLSAADDILRHEGDAPSIGIIMCKGRNEVIVEYSLRDTTKPMGISQYRLTEALPERLREALPTNEDLAREFPLLSLVALRMEIERELGTLVVETGLTVGNADRHTSVRELAKLLYDAGRLSPELVARVNNIANTLNAVVHGLDIRADDASSVFEEGTRLLALIRESGPSESERR